MLPPPQPARKRMANTRTLILSMKSPLENGDRDRKTNPFWPEELQGAQRNVKFRLLNSEDFLSASQFNPRRRNYRETGRRARALLSGFKSNILSV